MENKNTISREEIIGILKRNNEQKYTILSLLKYNIDNNFKEILMNGILCIIDNNIIKENVNIFIDNDIIYEISNDNKQLVKAKNVFYNRSSIRQT